MSKEHPIFQSIMDSAYTKWQDPKNKGISYLDFLNLLTPLEKKAVVLGNMNYQVQNGGWIQWVDNGYAVRSGINTLIETLSEINTDESKKAKELVEHVTRFVDLDADTRGFNRDYWLKEEVPGNSYRHGFGYYDEYDDEEEENIPNLDIQDKEYYEIDDKLVDQIEEFLTKMKEVL